MIWCDQLRKKILKRLRECPISNVVPQSEELSNRKPQVNAVEFGVLVYGNVDRPNLIPTNHGFLIVADAR